MNNHNAVAAQRTSPSRTSYPSCDRRVTRPALLYIWNLAVSRDILVTKKLLLFAALLLLPTMSRAQVVAAGKGGNQQLYVGVTAASFDPDYGYQRLYGIGAYGDYNLTPRLGAEAEVRFYRFNQLANIHEDSYLVGPRYSYHRRRYTLSSHASVRRRLPSGRAAIWSSLS